MIGRNYLVDKCDIFKFIKMIVNTIQHKHYPSASKLIATAYYDNPAHIHMFPNAGKRLQDMEWLLGENLKLQLKHGAKSFCLVENGIVQAMGFWTKPNNYKVGLMAKIQAGFLQAPFKIGFHSFLRVLNASSTIEKQLQTVLQNQSYWYLNNMVMQEAQRGKGLGSKLLQQEMETIRQDDKNAVFALSTQRISTTRFYKRLEFEIKLEERIGKDETAFTNWIMVKY
jgi:GNAT superfamily N-acetyltransferase